MKGRRSCADTEVYKLGEPDSPGALHGRSRGASLCSSFGSLCPSLREPCRAHVSLRTLCVLLIQAVSQLGRSPFHTQVTRQLTGCSVEKRVASSTSDSLVADSFACASDVSRLSFSCSKCIAGDGLGRCCLFPGKFDLYRGEDVRAPRPKRWDSTEPLLALQGQTEQRRSRIHCLLRGFALPCTCSSLLLPVEEPSVSSHCGFVCCIKPIDHQ